MTSENDSAEITPGNSVAQNTETVNRDAGLPGKMEVVDDNGIPDWLEVAERKSEAVVLVDELITTAKHGKDSAARYPHGWLDDNGRNDWAEWKTYIQDKENAVMDSQRGRNPDT